MPNQYSLKFVRLQKDHCVAHHVIVLFCSLWRLGQRNRQRNLAKDAVFSQPSRQLFVGNVNFFGQNAEFEAIFSAFGPLERINYYSHLRFAFVVYLDLQTAILAKEACAVNPPFVGGRKLIVNFGTVIRMHLSSAFIVIDCFTSFILIADWKMV